MKILGDTEIKKLIGTVILDGNESCIRLNACIVRLGTEVEFHNSGKKPEHSNKKKRGIAIPQGHSVEVAALETLDFRRETVQKIFPGNDLCGSLWLTRDLLRKGIVAPATHVDAGFTGTLNWMLTNTSSVERRYLYGERICRLAIYKLEEDETPEFPYEGDYQSKTGYTRSRSQESFRSLWNEKIRVGSDFWGEGAEARLDLLLRSGFS